MNRGKKLALLSVVLVIMIGASFAAVKMNSDSQNENSEESSIFTLDTDKVSALSWTYQGETISFSHSDDGWHNSNASDFPVDKTYIDNMLSALSDVKSDKTIESVEDLSEYGLDEPACTITVAMDGDTKLLIGNETGIGGERYFYTGDGNVYLVDTALLDSFSYGLYDLVKKEDIPDMSKLSSFRVDSDTQLIIDYLENSGLTYSDDYVWFLRDGDSYLTLDTELTDDFVRTVTGLSWGECVNYNADDSALTGYGLSAPSAVVTVNYVEGSDTDSENSTTKENSAEFVLEIGGYVDDSCYARISGSKMIYLIDREVCDTLLSTEYNELRPDEVLSMDWDTVDKIDIALDGAEYHIERSDGSGNEAAYLLNGEKLPDTSFPEELNNVIFKGYSDETPQGQGEKIRFKFHRNTETFKEVELVFYEFDDSSCLASLNGSQNMLADSESVASVIEDVNSLVKK